MFRSPPSFCDSFHLKGGLITSTRPLCLPSSLFRSHLSSRSCMPVDSPLIPIYLFLLILLIIEILYIPGLSSLTEHPWLTRDLLTLARPFFCDATPTEVIISPNSRYLC